MILCYCCSFSLTVSAEKPDLLQLLKMDFPSRVGPKINLFGSFLLKDTLGSKMANITENCQGRPADMAMEVLREWLAGKGVEVSWYNLIATLKKSKLPLTAKQIEMALNQLSNEMTITRGRQEEMEKSKPHPPTVPEISPPRSGFSCPQN